ncbi:hypothetical protein Bca4012_043737 [Brassica carinata]
MYLMVACRWFLPPSVIPKNRLFFSACFFYAAAVSVASSGEESTMRLLALMKWKRKTVDNLIGCVDVIGVDDSCVDAVAVDMRVPLQPEKQESLGSHSPIISQYAAQHYLHPDQSLQDHTGTVANISIHSHTDHQSLDHNTPDHNNTPPNHESPIHNTSDHYNNHINHESPVHNTPENPNPTIFFLSTTNSHSHRNHKPMLHPLPNTSHPSALAPRNRFVRETQHV